ncbi:hypothetical protein D4S03_02155 [bacterium]|nr:MAG: hypothetical protein D4S03_02155 [bacterium]
MFKDQIMTKSKVKSARALLRQVQYPVDMVLKGQPTKILLEGYFHQWFVDAKTQLKAVVETPAGFIVLLAFDDFCFVV